MSNQNDENLTQEEMQQESTTPSEQDSTPEGAAIEGALAMATLQAEVEKFKDIAFRSAADFENYRKRSVREKEAAVKYANVQLLEKLIPILDNFDLGIQAARADGNAKGIVAGFEMVHRQIQDFLIDCGVEPIDAVGAAFDPNLHEAVGQEASAEMAEGLVLRQLRRGFRLKDRLIRPSMVIVSKG